jgi:hypothetical protein
MSNAKTILKDIQNARDQVMELCGLTSEELAQLQWDGAMQCLHKVLGSDEYGIAELPKTSDFWLWWKDQWYRRDEAFLESLKFDVDRTQYTCAFPGEDLRLYLEGSAQMKGMYLRYHRMAGDNPLVNNNTMEVSFHQMIKDIVKRNHF